MDTAGVTPEDINELADLAKLPYSEGKELTEDPYGFVTVPRDELVDVTMSGGTTGKPKMRLATFNDIDDFDRIASRSYYGCGVRKSDVVLNLQPYGIWRIGMGIHNAMQRIGALVIPLGDTDFVNVPDLMRIYQPTVIFCSPSVSLAIHQLLQDEGIDPSQTGVRTLILAGEASSKEKRQAIAESWGKAEIYNFYGNTEFGGVGVECSERDGLHFWMDDKIMELLDVETGATSFEGKGEMVLTTINREGMPFIRYKIRDLAEVTYEPCPCGRTHPRFWPRGRADQTVILKDGVNVYPYQIDAFLDEIPEATNNWQLVIEDYGEDGTQELLTVRAEVKPGTVITDELLENANEKFKRLSVEFVYSVTSYGDSALTIPKVELVEFDTLPRTPRGKMKDRVSDKRKKD
jgi:phenylacetate-CoA ligase